jgi:hypothetical protein
MAASPGVFMSNNAIRSKQVDVYSAW